MEFIDRVSAYPNRYIMTDESGKAQHVVLERADEPITPGTPLNAETFNNAFGSITPSGIGAAAADHEHDSRYYTKSEIDAMHENRKYISEFGEVNGLKYNQYFDGTLECWGEVTVTARGTDPKMDHCNLFDLLPVEFARFDAVSVSVLCSDPTSGELTNNDTLVHVQVSVLNVDANAAASRLVVRFVKVDGSSARVLDSDISDLRLSIHVWGDIFWQK